MVPVARVCLLRALPLVILVLVALKATGFVGARADSPRQLAERFLADTSAPTPALDAPAGGPALFTDVAPDMHFLLKN